MYVAMTSRLTSEEHAAEQSEEHQRENTLQSVDATTSSPTAHELVVVAVQTESTVNAVLRQHFGMDKDAYIRFDNRYYSATVPVRVYSPQQLLLQLRDATFCLALRNCSAVAVVSADDSDHSIAACKRIWGQLGKYCSDFAIRILFIGGNTLHEEDTYRLVDWALGHSVELVSPFVCAEDGVNLALRIERALECAKWPQLVAKQQQQSSRSETKPPAGAEDKITLTNPKNEVLQATRLRRRLDDADLSRLMNDMLLQDETDSDTST